MGSQSRELQPIEPQPRNPYLCGFSLESFNLWWISLKSLNLYDFSLEIFSLWGLSILSLIRMGAV